MIKITQRIASDKTSPKGTSKFLTIWITFTGINRMNLRALFQNSKFCDPM